MSGRALAIDLGLLAVLSVFVCLFARQPMVMDGVMLAAIGVRFWLWSRLGESERDLSPVAELGYFAICMLIGYGNDYNTVDRQRVYAYAVPSEFPELSSIPLWMLALWGIIVRALASLPRWRRLRIEPLSEQHVGARLWIIGALVVTTRLSIFRFFLHPVLSWLPFAVALGVAAILLRPGVRRLTLALSVAVLGVGVESLYVQVAGLHAYALGWLGGVPLWIALWWALAALLWGELSERLIGWSRPICSESRRCQRTG